MKPHRVKLSRKLGWKMPPGTVKVDRSTKFGNPFVIDHEYLLTRETALKWFRVCLDSAVGKRLYPALPAAFSAADVMKHFDAIASNMEHLRGKNLACWCDLDQPCHADILLEYANREGGGA